MCGSSNDTFTNVFCIPATSACPVRSFKFDTANGNAIVLSSEAKYGPPMIDVKLSEGGAPCFKERNNYNQ